MKKKVGIIGYGWVAGANHRNSYLQAKDVEIVAVCDVNPARLAVAKKDFNLSDDCLFDDYKKLIDSGKCEMVDICTPNYLHSIIGVDALNSGVHVLCEKPDAVSVAEAERMKKAAEDAGKHLMVIRNNRFRHSSTYLKKYIADGNMGDIYCGRV